MSGADTTGADTTMHTDVLVVGSGPAGAAMALALATYGVRTAMITKYGRLADSPRAHITNQRTVEVFRDLGIEDLVLREGTPWHLMGNTTYCTSLAGLELGRIPSWGTDPRRHADYLQASPCPMVDAPQTVIEPILVSQAQARGAKIRFDTEYLSHQQDESGVTTTVRDRLTSREHTVRSQYVVGADGARSRVAQHLGLPFEGPGAVGGALSIVFEADLTRFVAHRPSVLYWMVQPGAGGGVGLGVLRMIKPWTEWMLIWGYDVASGPPELSDEFVRELAVALVGTDDFEMRVTSRSPWTINHEYATRIADGRVFCVGDAIHRHPPTNGLGSNTSIQDSYNLAWKLAHVARGVADPSLLDSYDAERAPIARQIVERANLSIAETGSIITALGTGDTSDAQRLSERLDVFGQPGPDGEKTRQAVREAISHKCYEFNAHGVEHNQRYKSSAVVPDGSLTPDFARDPELYAQPSTRPGAKLPHAWVTRQGHRVSTLDLGGGGRFAVFTGIGGDVWREAAEVVATEFGVDLPVLSIGPGQHVEDPYGSWAGLREIDDDGVLLSRPDLYIAFRRISAPPTVGEATHQLRTTLAAVLGRWTLSRLEGEMPCHLTAA